MESEYLTPNINGIPDEEEQNLSVYELTLVSFFSIQNLQSAKVRNWRPWCLTIG